MPFLSYSIEDVEINPATVNAKVNALVSENSDNTDVVIYTSLSCVIIRAAGLSLHLHITKQSVQEASGPFSVMTGSMPVEIMVVTRVYCWLESHDYTHSCIMSDSMSMI